ncbi:MAG: DUF4296 domain-containing protein [Flavobacteriaceae bacterium]|nr:DUF4296 domain-containing protein [Flavobacteriaceae bacterium]
MKKIIYIVFVLFFTACENKVNYEKPENLIPKSQMIDLLYDMHIANSTQGVKEANSERNKNYMSLIYEKHKIDSTRFAVSNTYYTSNISEYEDIFEEVEIRLKVLLDKYEKERDSIVERNLDSSKVRPPLKKINRVHRSKIVK